MSFSEYEREMEEKRADDVREIMDGGSLRDCIRVCIGATAPYDLSEDEPAEGINSLPDFSELLREAWEDIREEMLEEYFKLRKIFARK